MIKYFCDPFGKIFNFPPQTFAIAEAAPLKTGTTEDSVKEESTNNPEPVAEPVKSSAAPCPVVESVSDTIEVAAVKKKTHKVKAKSLHLADKEKGSKEMGKEKYHHEECHDEYEKDCYFPEVPVVMKAFEWCDYQYYYDDVKKFEEYIKEYYCKYPCVLITYKKIYPSKCKVRYCVFFNLCDYEKAWDIEKKLQKIYREMKMHHHYYPEEH